MRQFQKILHELKDVVANHKPGDLLTPPPSLPSIEIDGRRLSYATAGLDHGEEKPPVVLLHGFGGFFMDWPRVMAMVARQTRVYALDLPGWGFSDLNRDAKSMEDDVTAVNEFMERLGLNRVILSGLSYGGGVAWAAAAMNLPRVASAVLLNPMPPHPLDFLHSPLYQGVFFLNSSIPTSVWGSRFLRKSQYKMICRENLLNDRLLDTFYLDLAYMVIKQPKMPIILHAHAKAARELDWTAWEHRLAGVKMPVTILQGRDDKIFSLESAHRLHLLIPNSELVEIDDCGHAMVFDQHRKASDHILRHVAAEMASKETHEFAKENLRKKRA